MSQVLGTGRKTTFRQRLTQERIECRNGSFSLIKYWRAVFVVVSGIRGRAYIRCVASLATVFIMVIGFFAKGSAGESKELTDDMKGITKNVLFTEKFYLQNLPDALEKEESLEGLNTVEIGDVSLLPENEIFSPDLNARTTTRYSLELESGKDDKEGRSSMSNVSPELEEDELSYIEDDDEEEIDYESVGKDIKRGIARRIKTNKKEEDEEKDPGEEEQKRLLKLDTEEKRKLLKLRKKHSYKDIAFGPQVEHLAMTDIFGETGEKMKDPLAKKYGLESFGAEGDMEILEEAWGSVVFPSKLKQKKIWGYDKEGRPIYSEKNWIKKKLNGDVDETYRETGEIDKDGLHSGESEYKHTLKFYGVDGFLDSLGICSVKSLLDKYKHNVGNINKDKKELNEYKEKKNNGPEIVKNDMNLNSKKRSLQQKQANWLSTYNMEKVEAKKLARDLEGVEDLKGVIEVLNLKSPSAQRKDAEAVFREYYLSGNKGNKKKNDLTENNVSLDLELALPSFSIFKNKKKILYGWREALFDQAIDNLGKHDPRAKKFSALKEKEEIRGIPPSRIITNLSSEALRRPTTHHCFGNMIKGIKNLLFKRLEKKYRQYVSEIIEIRSKDSIYNELMNLADIYEKRQEWLRTFQNPWLFIPQGVVFSEETPKNQTEQAEENSDYKDELLSLELDSMPHRNIDIFMKEHLKGDVLFPDEKESQEQKEAMLRKIIKEAALYNEKQQYRLPHRSNAIKRRLPTPRDLYDPAEAIKKREELNKKRSLTLKGRVVATPTEKENIKILEKNAKKTMESKTEDQELAKRIKKVVSTSEEPKYQQESFTLGKKVKKASDVNGEQQLLNEYVYKDEGRGPRNIKPPFSTTAVSVIRSERKTVYDDIIKDSD